MTARRTLAGFAVIGLLALVGATVTTTAAGAATTRAPAAVDPVDKPSKDPRPCHGPDCPTSPPNPGTTATGTPGAPPPSTVASDDPPPGGSAVPAPGSRVNQA